MLGWSAGAGAGADADADAGAEAAGVEVAAEAGAGVDATGRELEEEEAEEGAAGNEEKSGKEGTPPGKATVDLLEGRAGLSGTCGLSGTWGFSGTIGFSGTAGLAATGGFSGTAGLGRPVELLGLFGRAGAGAGDAGEGVPEDETECVAGTYSPLPPSYSSLEYSSSDGSELIPGRRTPAALREARETGT